MNKRLRKISRTLQYVDISLIVITGVFSGVSISLLAIVIGSPIGLAIASKELKACLCLAIIKNILSIIRKKKDKHNQIVLLARTKLNIINVLIYKGLDDSDISHEEFVLVPNELKDYNEMRKNIRTMKSEIGYINQNDLIAKSKYFV